MRGGSTLLYPAGADITENLTKDIECLLSIISLANFDEDDLDEIAAIAATRAHDQAHLDFTKSLEERKMQQQTFTEGDEDEPG